MLLWVLWGSVMFHLGTHRKTTVAIFCLSNWRGRCLFQMLMGNKKLPASRWFPLQPQNLWHEPWNAWNGGPTRLTLFKNSQVLVFVFATTSATKVSFQHGQKSTVWPLKTPEVTTTAAQTPAEVAESTGEADSSVNKRPAHMTVNDPQNFHYKWCIPGKPRKVPFF